MKTLIQNTCPLCLSGCDKDLGSNDALRREYLRCAECSLIFVPARQHLSEEDEKERYDQHNNDPQDENYRRFLSKLTAPLSKYLKPQWEGLDYGCGPGPAIAPMLEGLEVVVKNYDPYFYPDQRALDRKYDFITCTEVVEHFNSPRKEFLKLNDLLKGRSSILAVMTEVWREKGAFDQWWYQKDPAHISFYSEHTLHWISGWLGWESRFVHENVVIFIKK